MPIRIQYLVWPLALSALMAPRLDAKQPLIPVDAHVEKVWSEGKFTEGPAYGPGGFIYFSDIINNRIMRYDPRSGQTSVYREPSGRSNGLDFDPQGRLVAAESNGTRGNRRITITEKDGSLRVLADRWQDKRFHSPNDVTIDAKGRVYFSDPRYSGKDRREIATESVYRIDPDGTVVQIITDVRKPNGVLVSPDMKTLYVADSDPFAKQYLLAYPLKSDGTVGPKQVLYQFPKGGIDGMCADVEGHIYGAVGGSATGGIYVFDPDGKERGFLHLPESPTNCVFGGPDRKTLYITAGKSLYRVGLKIKGFAVYWPEEAREPSSRN